LGSASLCSTVLLAIAEKNIQVINEWNDFIEQHAKLKVFHGITAGGKGRIDERMLFASRLELCDPINSAFTTRCTWDGVMIACGGVF